MKIKILSSRDATTIISVRRPRTTAPASAGQVFGLIREGGAHTRAELARRTGLSRTAIEARLAPLTEAGLVAEAEPVDAGAGAVGRPGVQLRFNEQAGVVLSAAIGRSRAQLAVCDLGATILAHDEFDQEPGLGPDDVMASVLAALQRCLNSAGLDPVAVRGVGLSIPGTVDGSRLCSYKSPIMAGWNGVRLDAYFTDLTTAPVFLDNDTNVIAHAERRTHLQGVRDALIVKASTGLGAGILAGGRLQRGARGAAGDIGHVKYAPAAGLPCRCGERGCLEAVAAGWALVATMREQGFAVAHVRDVAALAEQGNLRARHLIRESGRHFGRILAGAVTLLDPSVIVIGGDMNPAYETFVAGLRESLYRDASAIATEGLQIVPATHGAASGLLGAATLALDNVLSADAVDRALTV